MNECSAPTDLTMCIFRMTYRNTAMTKTTTKRLHPPVERHGRIAAAAVKDDTGEVYSLPPPFRHHEIMHHFKVLAAPSPPGLITAQGERTGRKRALRIARAANQIIRETFPSQGLFSENVW